MTLLGVVGAMMLVSLLVQAVLRRLYRPHLLPDGRYTIGIDRGQLFIQCRVCGYRSFNSNDIEALYCGHCHEFMGTDGTDGVTV